MSKKVQTLDVREALRSGREPFSTIMQTIASLRPGESLKLIAPFEPTPLYAVLVQQGFSHQASAVGDHFEVLFSPGFGSAPEPSQSQAGAHSQSLDRTCTGSPVLEVDARGLEPPQPLVTILETVANLPAGASLRALTDRRPMHLYTELEERGFVGTSEQQQDGSFITHITPR